MISVASPVRVHVVSALGAALLVSVTVSGCAFPSNRRVVSPGAVGKVQTVDYGVVEKVDAVVIAGRRSALGTIGGGAVGAAAASEIGHGAGRRLAQAGGAVVGAVAGQAVEEAVTRQAAQELHLRLDSGKTVVVTQPVPPEFRPGDRVALVSGGAGPARVTYP